MPITAAASRYDVIQTRPFGLLSMGGRIKIGYFFDERINESASVSSKDSTVLWEEELFLRTKSFVYHPGFLNIELGGGPVFVQEQIESGSEDGSSTDTLFNIYSRLNFLEIKRGSNRVVLFLVLAPILRPRRSKALSR